MRTRTVLRAMGAGALLALGLNAGTAAAAAFTLSACELEHPLRLTVVAAECGVLSVAENPQAPSGRHIGLHVARVPAISRRKQADPLFILAGGPGAAATAFYATVAGAFARIHRDRDIVLIERRGTGRSNPLDCEADEALLYRATDTEIANQTQRCLTRLSARSLGRRAHQPVRHLLWHPGRAALPAPLSAARPRGDSRWRRAGAAGARAGHG